MNEERALTEGESELMEALWRLGEGTVREVLEALPPERALAYTSVATFLKILEEKGFVVTEKNERRLVYRPLVAREAYVGGSVRRLVSRWFGGEAGPVLRQLVGESVSDAELRELRGLIDGKLQN